MKKRFQKALAGFLTFALLLSVLPGGLANATLRANAAQAKISGQNLIADPGFEDTDHPFVTDLPVEPVPGRVGNWHQYKEVNKAAEQPHTGDYAAKIVGGEASLEQDVDNLTPGATYTYKIWVKNTAPQGNRLWVGVKNYGGSEKKVLAQSSDYQEVSISFTMGASNTKARVYVWLNPATSSPAISMMQAWSDADIANVAVENGKVDVQQRGLRGQYQPV
ncbi:MAG: carbohydrate binding domain-containing protein [Oscillospiraceae bacterium]